LSAAWPRSRTVAAMAA
jgi:hypothetical protein